jgi:hypothetical protein
MNPAIPSNVCAFFTMDFGDDDLNVREYRKPSERPKHTDFTMHLCSMLATMIVRKP